MNRLDRYIARRLLFTTAIAWLLLTSLDSLFALLGELRDTGRGNYTLDLVFLYILLSVPQRAVELFPVAALLGGLTGLGSFDDHDELLAMRIAGFSPLRLLRSVWIAAGVMLVLLVPLGEFVAPVAQQEAQRLRSVAIFDRVSLLGEQGLWVRDGSQFVNVRGVGADGRLAGIRLYDFSGYRLKRAGEARHADLEQGRWQLVDLNETLFDGNRLSLRHSDSETRTTGLTPELISVLVSAPESMSLAELSAYIRYLKRNGIDARRYRLAFWQRAAVPLQVMVMPSLGVIFVLGVLRRAGSGRRIFAGAVVGLVFYLVSDLLAQLSLVYGLGPFAGAFTPLLLLLVPALYVLWRQSRRQRVT